RSHVLRPPTSPLFPYTTLFRSVIHTVVGSPGIFDPASGRLQLAPNLPGWTRRGLVDALHDELASSLAIDNDVNLAALGERAFGRSEEHTSELQSLRHLVCRLLL